jgi:hypothetical protein
MTVAPAILRYLPERSGRVTAAVVAGARSRRAQLKLVDFPGADHHVRLDDPGGFTAPASAWLGHAA